ncbi:pyrethroid hydrolase Ces2a [Biomphalaria pfeifferi]|uniref:Pyrethroid hydrolase Ces2a n=1 Tax=Biomphalaria pfeifferi TaxID=112525 RepID=A0AAD8F5S8_BIOPF|nr:pyrethroid hydrolase Ces2a [Biomphalaria pfeifferi]
MPLLLPTADDGVLLLQGAGGRTRAGSTFLTPQSESNPPFDDVIKIVGTEDWLYINIWTPSLAPKELLLVTVRIHSGDFVYGSGNMPGMSLSSATPVSSNAV